MILDHSNKWSYRITPSQKVWSDKQFFPVVGYLFQVSRNKTTNTTPQNVIIVHLYIPLMEHPEHQP